MHGSFLAKQQPMKLNRVKRFMILLATVIVCSSQSIFSQDFDPPFFVFEDGLWNAKSEKPAYWAHLVNETGFDGVELIGLDKLEGMLPELQKNNLKLFALYIRIDIDKDEPYDKRLKDWIKKLQNNGLYLWVHVHSERYKPSDHSGDKKCIEIITELAEYADPFGVKLAFYPHSDFWVEKVSDGVRLASKIDRNNVGTVFNLCHFLKKDNKENLENEIRSAMPHLFLVSVNGADDGDTKGMGWDRLIQPLGEGTYNVYRVLEILKELGYKNPVGLQCYNIKGQSEVFLKSSITQWNEYIKRLNQ